jgi:adenosine/AMP kinase
MELLSARIEKPEAINFILGQTHFIKTALTGHGLATDLQIAS